jgi:uncharacterized coiled-coil protein SlyX
VFNNSTALAQRAANRQDRVMADGVENHTLRLLQEMRTEMRQGFGEMREGFRCVDERFMAVDQRLDKVEQRLDGLESRVHTVEGSLVKVIDSVTGIAKVQEKHSALLIDLVEAGQITGSRLNAVEGRLARIEKQAGFVLN